MPATIRPLAAGNWKMNMLRAPGTDLAGAVAREVGAREAGALSAEVLICPPATLLAPLAEVLAGTAVKLGAQDCHAAESGAHTGDVSAAMLADIGCAYVIVGHSERRHDHGEGDALVHDKAAAAWNAGLTAIICIGETLDQREGGATLDVLQRQIEASVPAGGNRANTVIAYEPVWAIGTGRTPTQDEIAAAHAHIRATAVRHLGADATGIRLLYGGSVKPANAPEILAIEDVNGALVGGASLAAADFIAIAKSCV